MDLSTTLASLGYQRARPATEADRTEPPLSAPLRAVESFTETLRRAEELGTRSLGGGDADPHALVQALAETGLAVETAVAVRDRVVEAYQEILRMPI
ncbi:flagellar hook-basal body complex protein FliE [Frigidibacter sp. MR17.24]|uniref:flagellar hook-basal body complex protein FliE n=1 Tax=Frigidibacter sp. MR17.24 TaxID=3127345 RepID=UPI003012C267